jgi:hypothetical protein
MQTEQTISIPRLHELVAAVYEQGEPLVKEAYSASDAAALEFIDARALLADISIGQLRHSFLDYAIYYRETKGVTVEERIDLETGSAGAHRFRFRQLGWGLIHLQCDFRRTPSLRCRIAVNSKARACSWSSAYPQLGDPESWDWDMVTVRAGRLVRLLRKFGRAAEQRAPANAAKRPERQR